MKSILGKNTVINHVLTTILASFVKVGIIVISFTAVLFVILQIIGKYADIETALDLKYDSPIFAISFYVLFVLAVISFAFGLLLYFYKYKRPSKKSSTFYKSFSAVLSNNNVL